jgi:steroid 5-alpha reductase family enzyme
MTVLYLQALAAIAVSLSILMAGAWVAQQRTGNSGWVDMIWTFSLGLVGAGSARWPVAGASPNARQWLVAALVAVWSLRLGLAPVFMYWILVYVTGIPPLEAQMLRSRGARYRDYQSRTSQFFLLPPHA